MLKMEVEKFFIQILDFGLEGDKFIFHLFVFSYAVENHNQELFIYLVILGRVEKQK